jgi:hypothetical protein
MMMKKSVVLTVGFIIFMVLLFVWSIYQNPPELPEEHQQHESSRQLESPEGLTGELG